jgi:hypothetical protein
MERGGRLVAACEACVGLWLGGRSWERRRFANGFCCRAFARECTGFRFASVGKGTGTGARTVGMTGGTRGLGRARRRAACGARTGWAEVWRGAFLRGCDVARASGVVGHPKGATMNSSSDSRGNRTFENTSRLGITSKRAFEEMLNCPTGCSTAGSYVGALARARGVE